MNAPEAQLQGLPRPVWRQPVVDYRGEFHRIGLAGLAPRPSRAGTRTRSEWTP